MFVLFLFLSHQEIGAKYELGKMWLTSVSSHQPRVVKPLEFCSDLARNYYVSLTCKLYPLSVKAAPDLYTHFLTRKRLLKALSQKISL